MAQGSETESSTRANRVDQQLSRAGWSKNRRTVLEEVPLVGPAKDGTTGPDQFADYVLLGSDGQPLAVVEAKRTSRDELAGKRQAADYADAIMAKCGLDPFIFLTNGREIHSWDRQRYSPRKIAGFYTRDDLDRLRHQQRHAESLHHVTINGSIAGRDYQTEAIRRVTEGIDGARRRFLLVMATGTGKTRTTIALIDTLFRARRVQRVLFLADRRELVRQAMSEFKSHLPNESLSRIEGGETSGARIQFSTYPSMMQVLARLSVGYFDLIVADESHRPGGHSAGAIEAVQGGERLSGEGSCDHCIHHKNSVRASQFYFVQYDYDWFHPMCSVCDAGFGLASTGESISRPPEGYRPQRYQSSTSRGRLQKRGGAPELRRGRTRCRQECTARPAGRAWDPIPTLDLIQLVRFLKRQPALLIVRVLLRFGLPLGRAVTRRHNIAGSVLLAPSGTSCECS